MVLLSQKQPPIKKLWLNDNLTIVDELIIDLPNNIKTSGKYLLIIDNKENKFGEKETKYFLYFKKSHNYNETIDKTDFSNCLKNKKLNL